MDINSISQASAVLSTLQTNQDIGVAVLRKALDADAAAATELIDAVPSVNLPDHLGQNIDTTA